MTLIHTNDFQVTFNSNHEISQNFISVENKRWFRNRCIEQLPNSPNAAVFVLITHLFFRNLTRILIIQRDKIVVCKTGLWMEFNIETSKFTLPFTITVYDSFIVLSTTFIEIISLSHEYGAVFCFRPVSKYMLWCRTNHLILIISTELTVIRNVNRIFTKPTRTTKTWNSKWLLSTMDFNLFEILVHSFSLDVRLNTKYS